MKQRLTWAEKYRLALQEEMTLKDIQALRDCGQPKAVSIRNLCIEYSIKNDIVLESRSVPTALVFAVTGYNLDYYYEKALQESRCLAFSEA